MAEHGKPGECPFMGELGNEWLRREVETVRQLTTIGTKLEAISERLERIEATMGRHDKALRQVEAAALRLEADARNGRTATAEFRHELTERCARHAEDLRAAKQERGELCKRVDDLEGSRDLDRGMRKGIVLIAGLLGGAIAQGLSLIAAHFNPR